MSKTQIAIVYYSMYGHIRRLAQEVKKGLEKVDGVAVKLYQVPETLPQEVLEKMHAPPKSDDPIATPEDLKNADGILFGLASRYGSASAQMKAFMDSTGQLWMAGALRGKPAGIFFSTGGQGGGQETTALTFLTHFAHHGLAYVPLGYADKGMHDNSEVHGGSPWGAGTLAGDGKRQPSELELGIAATQGETFGQFAKALKTGRDTIAKK